MITDDQVARLVRDAGHAAPPSLRVDLGAVEQRVAHDRTVARTTGLLSTFALLLAVMATWLNHEATFLGVTPAAGGKGTARSWAPVLAVLGLVLVAVVVTVVAGRSAAQTEPRSRQRTSVAASFGVLGLLSLGPVVYLTSALIVYPGRFAPAGHLLVVYSAVVLTFFGLSWLALTARRRVLGAGPGAFLSAVWVVAAWGVGAWVTFATASQLWRFGSRTTYAVDPHSVLSVTAALAVAVACCSVLRRRNHDDHPFLTAAALTVTWVATLPAYAIGSALLLGTPDWLDARGAGLPLAIGFLGAAVLTARISLPRGSTGAWLDAALAVATMTFATAAAIGLWATFMGALVARAGEGTSLAKIAWSLSLSVAAGVCLATVDRRGGWAPRRATRSDDVPAAARVD